MDKSYSEQLIGDFHHSLIAGGMSRHSARRYRDKLRFFLHAYLAEEWPRGIDRVDGQMVRDFLGTWFLQYVGGAKSDLLSYLDAFRRFYDFLYHAGRITEPEHDEIMMVCESRDYFMERHDELTRARPDAWEDFAGGGPARDSGPAGEAISPVDRQLWMLARNIEAPPAPAVLDFNLFLDYISAVPIRLTSRGSRIPQKHVARINDRFSMPEDMPQRSGMESSRRIVWFLQTALSLGLVRAGDANTLENTRKAEIYMDLEPETRRTILLDSLWNRTCWGKLSSPDTRRVSEWAWEHRDGFAALLSEIPPNREWKLDPDFSFDRQDALLARYILFHEVVERNVLFGLRETGVLEYAARSKNSPANLDIRSITMTRFGRQVMKLFAKRAARSLAPEWDPLARLQECLLV